MPGYCVPSKSLVHLSALPVAVLSEIGAHAVTTAATSAASLHTLRMGRIIAHPANRRQHATRVRRKAGAKRPAEVAKTWSGPRAVVPGWTKPRARGPGDCGEFASARR